MCSGKDPNGRRAGDEQQDITMDGLLSAISETEYPQYLLDALERIQQWMSDSMSASADRMSDPFASLFEDVPENDLEGLFERLDDLENHADLIPNTKRPEGRSDAVVLSMNPPDYESGVRTAIDYAALFNRNHCKRVWVVSNTFLFEDTLRYVAHVEALAQQGILVRFILVNPWGWVEIPLCGSTASNRQFLWRAPNPKPRNQREGKGNS